MEKQIKNIKIMEKSHKNPYTYSKDYQYLYEKIKEGYIFFGRRLSSSGHYRNGKILVDNLNRDSSFITIIDFSIHPDDGGASPLEYFISTCEMDDVEFIKANNICFF